jgi:serine/threonine protein kinase/formylglycine-generating enzyme required for sulfatase activity
MTNSRPNRTIATFMATRGMDGGVELTDDTVVAGRDAPATVAEDAPRLALKDAAHKYTVGQFLAKGGMGAILRLRDLNCRRSVAMKVMLGASESASDEGVLRFIEEAQITGQLEHPNIVPVHELGVDRSDNVFFTMDLVRGDNLRTILSRIRDGDADTIAAYPLRRLLTVFEKICDAMAFAHSRGVIHRDLKPENVMVGAFGEVLVMDWGLAKVLGRSDMSDMSDPSDPSDRKRRSKPRSLIATDRQTEDVQLTQQGAIMGTAQYMAPEQAHGKVDELDARTDVYALGAILYHILALRPPIAGQNLNQILMQLAKGEIEPPRATADQAPHCPKGRIPEALDAVTMKAMALEPADRYADARALATDINAFQNGFATSVETVGRIGQLTRLARRHRAETVALAASVLLLLGVIGGALHQLRQSQRDARTAEAEAKERIALLTASQAKTGDLRLATARFGLLKAKRHVDAGEWEQALTLVDDAIAVDRDQTLAEAHYLRGRILLSELKLQDAIDAFNKADDIDHKGVGRQARALKNIAWKVRRDARRHNDGRVSLAQLTKMAAQLQERGDDAVAARIFERMLGAAKTDDQRLAIVKQLLEIANPDAGAVRIEWLEPGRIGMADNPNVVDISALRHLELTGLKAGNTGIEDGSPLADLPLTELHLDGTRIRDLAFVKDMPLTVLTVFKTEVSDLAPLRGKQLKFLNIAYTQVTDLSPLQGMPLDSAGLEGLAIKDADLQALGSTVHNLMLADCAELRDMSAVARLNALEKLLLPPAAENLDALRRLPKLKEIGYDHGAQLPTAEFWAKHDAGVWELVRELRARNPGYDGRGTFTVRDGKLTDVMIVNGSLRTLTPLRGAHDLRGVRLGMNAELSDISVLAELPKLAEVKLYGTSVHSIDSLSGLPLKMLGIAGTKVVDLETLAQFDLEDFGGAGLPIYDLNVLRGMPLQLLKLNHTPLTQTEVLQSMTNLRMLILPAHMTGFESTREFPELQQFSHRWINEQDTTRAAEFWQGYDKRQAEVTAYGAAIRELDPAIGTPAPLAAIRMEAVAPRLELLKLAECANVRDLAPLTKARALKALLLPAHLDVEAARQELKHVRFIGSAAEPLDRLRIALFEKNPWYDMHGHFETTADGVVVELNGAKVWDLSPLAGMTLLRLDLSDTPVTRRSLEMLAGTQVQQLRLSGTLLTSDDLRLLKGAGIRRLRLDGCAKVTDLSALQELPRLRIVTLPWVGDGVDVLRDHPSLERIATIPGDDGEPVADFWARRDRGRALIQTLRTEKPLYIAIDVSAGPAASDYPVTTFDAEPADLQTNLQWKTTHILMRRIEAGSFVMGSPEKEWKHWIPSGRAETQHRVTLTQAFYLAVFETTVGVWARVGGAQNEDLASSLPKSEISRNDVRGAAPPHRLPSAGSWLSALSLRGGVPIDLPTEAQWEYACRASTATPFSFGGDAEKFHLYGNYADVQCTDTVWPPSASKGVTDDGYALWAPVGQYRPNPWGLYDMHGNAMEWVRDGRRADLGSGAVEDPLVVSAGGVLRGGSLGGAPVACRSAYRGLCPADKPHHRGGFRLSLTVDAE